MHAHVHQAPAETVKQQPLSLTNKDNVGRWEAAAGGGRAQRGVVLAHGLDGGYEGAVEVAHNDALGAWGRAGGAGGGGGGGSQHARRFGCMR